jgi:VIT1/CCC1 family predicted Fe2+/Mn2+ transporter
MSGDNTQRPSEDEINDKPAGEEDSILTQMTQVTVIITGIFGAAIPIAGLLVATQSLLAVAVVAVLALLGVLVLTGATLL